LNAHAQWTQWGGPRRDFTVEAARLAASWPEAGPRQIWRRELGDGYSTILVDAGVLFTMYRRGDDEFTVALRAADGKTMWEHRNPSPFTKTMSEYGPGPHATPLVAGDRLYSVGTNGILHCFDKSGGKVHWKRDLVAEFDGELRARGYSCSPLAWRSMLILPLGSEREGPGAVAFDLKTGDVIWKSPPFRATYAAPLMIRFDGQDQLVLFMASELVGMNPDNGEVLWSVEHRNQAYVNASTPVWNGRDVLFCSNAYDGGARAIRLTHDGGRTVPMELWYSTRMKLHHGNALLIGENVFASSGMGAAVFMGLKLATGEVLFRKRGLKKANALHAGGKLILLDEDGQLALATVSDEGLTIVSTCKVAEPHAWAAPTLAGTTLYVRDRKHILALDLGD
jgi:outer membrane protein assembly factor BamB